MPKFFVGESFTVALFSGTKKVWIRGGVSRFYVENGLSHNAENLRRESFTVALVSGIEKVCIRGGVSYFYVENFLSHNGENFRRGILYCCINFGYRKSLEKRGGSITFLRRNLFVTRYRKTFFANSSVYQKFSGIEYFYASEGYVTIFCRNFFVSQCRKSSQVKPSMLCFRNFR